MYCNYNDREWSADIKKSIDQVEIKGNLSDYDDVNPTNIEVYFSKVIDYVAAHGDDCWAWT